MHDLFVVIRSGLHAENAVCAKSPHFCVFCWIWTQEQMSFCPLSVLQQKAGITFSRVVSELHTTSALFSSEHMLSCP